MKKNNLQIFCNCKNCKRKSLSSIAPVGKKLPLLSLNESELVRVIQSLRCLCVFESEAQFQFSLAWALQQQFICDVRLEAHTANEIVKGKTKRRYTDIILEYGEERVAIELKYKKAAFDCGELSLLEQGAGDLALYDFWWDVKRNEDLVHSASPSTSEIEVKKKCTRAYAVLLTNEPLYWTKCASTTTNICKDFCIGEEDGKLLKSHLEWGKLNGETPKTVKGTWYEDPIVLHAKYTYRWYDYVNIIPKSGDGLFRFVVVETK